MKSETSFVSRIPHPVSRLYLPSMTRTQAEKRVRELHAELRHHDYLYYVKDAPEISDAAYDTLFQELKALEAQFPEFRTPDSPTQRVAGMALDQFPKVTHTVPMLSLDSSQDEDALKRFDDRLRKALGSDIRYVVDPKLDGASVELVYEGGVLVRASTRGDGAVGEGITENVRTIRSVPLRLRDGKSGAPSFLAVRGEVILRVAQFEKLNERLLEEGKEPFANPRNAAAGGLRQLDPQNTAQRPLDIYVYDILGVEGDEPDTQWEVLRSLEAWGFPVNELARQVTSVDEIVEYHAQLTEQRDDLEYEIDGVVVKLDDLTARDDLGVTSHHPRWAFAFKFPARKEVTRVLAIVPSVGRTGVVTPVAMLRPVELSGVTVSRASLHNREEVGRKDVREGDRVRVQRAGDVIPQVLERIAEPGRRRKPRFKMPTTCPSCGTPLIERGPFTVCLNGFQCPAQLAGRIQHFASRDALDIAGLGEGTSKQLVTEGLVSQLPDLFDLRVEQLLQ
ncbi:MAG: NAD-dependent DNA ligase LigA, partial [Gemmatimonadota bacterium]|nr:NAD-dependent DNA ligase LigA [Gemmatimonadota bacterium]